MICGQDVVNLLKSTSVAWVSGCKVEVSAATAHPPICQCSKLCKFPGFSLFLMFRYSYSFLFFDSHEQMVRFSFEIIVRFVLLTSVTFISSFEIVVSAIAAFPSTFWEIILLLLFFLRGFVRFVNWLDLWKWNWRSPFTEKFIEIMNVTSCLRSRGVSSLWTLGRRIISFKKLTDYVFLPCLFFTLNLFGLSWVARQCWTSFHWFIINDVQDLILDNIFKMIQTCIILGLSRILEEVSTEKWTPNLWILLWSESALIWVEDGCLGKYWWHLSLVSNLKINFKFSKRTGL